MSFGVNLEVVGRIDERKRRRTGGESDIFIGLGQRFA